MSKDNGKTKKADLPEILETDCEDKDRITLLLEKGLTLKQQIGTEPDEKKGTEGSGLLKEYAEVREELTVMQKLHGFEGLRHNNIAFTVSPREGRAYLDTQLLVEKLVEEGVDPQLIARCMTDATKHGERFYVREIVDLNVKKGGRKDASKGEWG